MKVKTLENLDDALDKHLAWRKKEMLSLKVLIDKENENSETLIRAGLALLCAHFEGFIKDASNDYLEYISSQDIIYKDLRDVFSVMKLHSLISNCAKSSKYSVQVKVLEKYNKLLSETFCNNVSVVDTHSNPSTETLKELLLSLGIETDIFKTKANYIDKRLLANRHKIVHGEKVELDYDDFKDTLKIILGLLDNYKDVLVDAATKQTYRK